MKKYILILIASFTFLSAKTYASGRNPRTISLNKMIVEEILKIKKEEELKKSMSKKNQDAILESVKFWDNF